MSDLSDYIRHQEAFEKERMVHQRSLRKRIAELQALLEGKDARIRELEQFRDATLEEWSKAEARLDEVQWLNGVSGLPCAICNGDVVEFSIPNAEWNKIVRENGHEEYLCFECFRSLLVHEAEARIAVLEAKTAELVAAAREAVEKLTWIMAREDFTFAECSVAEDFMDRVVSSALALKAALESPSGCGE